jgi:hypothetical protein
VVEHHQGVLPRRLFSFPAVQDVDRFLFRSRRYDRPQKAKVRNHMMSDMNSIGAAFESQDHAPDAIRDFLLWFGDVELEIDGVRAPALTCRLVDALLLTQHAASVRQLGTSPER